MQRDTVTPIVPPGSTISAARLDQCRGIVWLRETSLDSFLACSSPPTSPAAFFCSQQSKTKRQARARRLRACSGATPWRGRRTIRSLLIVAQQPPSAQPLYILSCVVAVAVTVSPGQGKRTPLLALTEPLGREPEFSGGLGDAVNERLSLQGLKIEGMKLLLARYYLVIESRPRFSYV